MLGSREEIGRALDLCFARTLGDVGALSRGDGHAVFTSALSTLAALAIPPALAAALFGTLVSMAQAGLRFDTDILGFQADRLNPLPKLANIFASKQALAQTALALLRVGIVGVVAYTALVKELPAILTFASTPTEVALARVTDTALHLTLRLLGALAVLAVADYAYDRFRLEKEMKMTLKELKEEMRSQDGDPKQKAKLRQKARQLSKKRMMGSVKNADVIPTHVAVALRYSAADFAPTVVAKGHDEVALAIRAEARKHGVVIVESRALARAIDAEIPIGKPIAGAHYNAVAQVLAFVYKIKQRKAGGTARA
jgi:flagellar biosynthetic protein FlhB